MHLTACLQMRTGPDIPENLDRVEALAARAAGAGARFVATPENTTFLGPPAQKVAIAEPLDGRTHRRLARIAKDLRIHLLVGSVAERLDNERCYNTSLLFGPSGELVALYRKIHLFDVEIPGGPSFRESVHIAPGDAVVVADTPFGRVGLTICYDLRFPELYRALVDKGAEIVAVPSAFTLQTGKEHWEPLLRARAIESQTWVLAPAQEGRHDTTGQRWSYGHTMVIDPWGCVVAQRSEGEGYVLAELDLDAVNRARTAIPVRQHRRLQNT